MDAAVTETFQSGSRSYLHKLRAFRCHASDSEAAFSALNNARYLQQCRSEPFGVPLNKRRAALSSDVLGRNVGAFVTPGARGAIFGAGQTNGCPEKRWSARVGWRRSLHPPLGRAEQRARNTVCWTLGGAPPHRGWTGQRQDSTAGGQDSVIRVTGRIDSGQWTADSETEDSGQRSAGGQRTAVSGRTADSGQREDNGAPTGTRCRTTESKDWGELRREDRWWEAEGERTRGRGNEEKDKLTGGCHREVDMTLENGGQRAVAERSAGGHFEVSRIAVGGYWRATGGQQVDERSAREPREGIQRVSGMLTGNLCTAG